jgi:tetratricopeptide (TPR) repeat protein
MEYVLKRILPSGIEGALHKADKYRELNQPAEAESICRDVLAVDPDNPLALRTLGLAMTDQLQPANGARFAEAKAVFARLCDPYERAFYTGLAYERQAKVQLGAGLPLRSVRPLFEEALARYADAETIRPPGNDDAILRWNSCVRALHAVPVAAKDVEAHVDVDPDFVALHR